MRVRIDRIGARGDGIAVAGDGPVYVPFAVPGDVAEVALGPARGEGRAARLVELIEAGPGRAEPPCAHFGVCGGCALQHLAADAYLDWKRERVAEALARQGLETEIRPILSSAPGTRRRARLAFRRTAKGLLLGFREAASRRVVDIGGCPVARPEIVALMPLLRDFLAPHASQGEVSVTLADTGLDLAVQADADIGLDLQMAAAPFCEAAGVARLSWAAGKNAPEPVVAMRRVQVRFGDATVELPIDAFLQPTAEGEAALAGFVTEGVGAAGRIADLYAGCGAFAVPLAAAGKQVHAVEGLAAQMQAIARADAGIGTEIRDLARRPLRQDELARFDAVVLDPPRAGAAPQAAEIAASAVPTVVYVSCNPATFARDARTLVDAGFILATVQPVDQFLWSPHVELASVFRRG